VIKSATELSRLLLFRETYSQRSSGIVVAGFGRDEIFPALIEYKTDGYVGRTLKISQMSESIISIDMSAEILPFGQREMVYAFMEGAELFFTNTIFKCFHDILAQECLDVLDKYGESSQKTDEVKNKICKAVYRRMDELREVTQEFSTSTFSDPILDMVSLMPKDELPKLAEALVSLTSVKRRFSQDVETVRGPTDVALITKGDGFIWIKRKHYFKPELNMHFGLNYMRGLNDGDAGDAGDVNHNQQPFSLRESG
jgi:hypothetical protein